MELINEKMKIYCLSESKRQGDSNWIPDSRGRMKIAPFLG